MSASTFTAVDLSRLPALDLIETAAILEPRRLRDGEGHAVEQLSPAAETAIAR